MILTAVIDHKTDDIRYMMTENKTQAVRNYLNFVVNQPPFTVEDWSLIVLGEFFNSRMVQYVGIDGSDHGVTFDLHKDKVEIRYRRVYNGTACMDDEWQFGYTDAARKGVKDEDPLE